jgi:hypothetical protein
MEVRQSVNARKHEGTRRMTKTAPLSAGLVAIKGAAAPIGDMPTRTAAQLALAKDERLAPLNFRVPREFRTMFKTYAAMHDLKLNQLLKLSFETYRKLQGD